MLELTDKTLLRNQNYINGAWVDADNGSTVAVTNPATGKLIIDIPNMGASETKRAIDGADHAFQKWRNVPAKERSAVLKEW